MFVKNPKPGDVKTRLARSIGDDRAANISRAFVLDTISMLQRTGIRFELCCWPNEDGAVEILGKDLKYRCQRGRDLSERIINAFHDAFTEGTKHVIVIGSDSPDLPAASINRAFEHLAFYDAVLGPALDGGYYLAGFSSDSFTEQAFRGIQWSTPQVLAQTRARLNESGRTVALLPPWQDIDTAEDLRDFVLRSRRGNNAKHTLRYISECLPEFHQLASEGIANV
jgi:rSAM/selenodomain-associated transferase 1